MKITFITIFFVFFSLSMVLNIILRIKQERTSIRSALIWLVLWISIGFFSLFPKLLNWATRAAQMENRVIFVLLMAVFVLFAFLFSFSARMDRLQRNIERLVQEIALINFKNELDQEKKD